MANVKTKIIINADGAVNELNKLQESASHTSKSLSQIKNDLKNTNSNFGFSSKSSKEQIASFDKLKTRLEEISNLYKITDQNGDSNVKTMKLYKQAILELGSSIPSDQLAYLKTKFDESALSVQKLGENSKTVTKEVKKNVTWFNKLWKIMKNIMGFQLVIGVVRKGLTAITNTLKDSVKASAELEQITSKLSTVFDGFSTSATKAASTLANKIGVATSTAASSLSTIGDLLQAQGMGTAESLETATRWAEQFQDIIAFKDINMSLNEFAENFMSGAAGNLRNFRTFGSIVKESAVNAELAKQGLDKLTGSELELAKMTIRAELALEQQANAMGATKREWETTLSINRRLTEATKEWKENLGTVLNDELKGIKLWWTKIVEEINRASVATREYNKLTAGDKKTKNRGSVSSDDTFMKYFDRQTNSRYGGSSMSKEELALYLQAWNKSVDDFMELVNAGFINMPADFEPYLREQEAIREAIEDQTKTIEKATSIAEKSISAYSSYRENLNGINGVSGVGSTRLSDEKYASYYGENGLTEELKSEIEKQILSDASEASRQIMEATADSMGKAMEASIGEFDTSSLLTMQKESMQNLYEQLWNNFRKADSAGGTSLTNKENAELEKVIENYKKLNEQLDEETKKTNASDFITSTRQTLTSQNYDRQMVNYYMNRGQSKEEAEINVKYDNQIKEIVASLEQMNASYEDNRFLIDETNRARQEELDAISKSTSAFDSIKEAFASSEWTNIIGGAKEGASKGSEMMQSLGSAMGLDPSGFLGETLSGIGGMLGGVVGILLELLSQTEVFQDVMSLLSDAIVPVLNMFLKPLMPVIKTVMSLIQTVVFAFLKPLFPVIKIVALILNTISGAVNAMWKWISAKNGDRKSAAAAAWSDAMSKNAEIKAMEFSLDNIDDNTEGLSDEFAYYAKLLQKGVINNSEYEALTSGMGLSSASVSTINGYRAGNNGVTYNTGDTIININADNYTSDQLINLVKRALAESQQAGATA